MNRIHRDAAVQGGEFTLSPRCKPKEIGIGYMRMGNDGIGFEDVQYTQILNPEMMTGCITNLLKNGTHSGNISRPVRVLRMTGYADKTVFGKGTCRPCLLPLVNEPLMRQVMMDMRRIGQRQQHIDVEKIRRQGSSSRKSK